MKQHRTGHIRQTGTILGRFIFILSRADGARQESLGRNRKRDGLLLASTVGSNRSSRGSGVRDRSTGFILRTHSSNQILVSGRQRYGSSARTA